MKKLIAVVAFLSLTGCASIMEMIPSGWDVNQAKVITDIQQQVRHFDCKADLKPQVDQLARDVEWFDIYAQTKPTRDIAKLTGTITDTVKELQDRIATGPVSPMYCDLKKKIIQQQVDIIAKSVQGRLF
jgi:PBP1b-binding outer membrane lipoprotein LpoB